MVLRISFPAYVGTSDTAKIARTRHKNPLPKNQHGTVRLGSRTVKCDINLQRNNKCQVKVSPQKGNRTHIEEEGADYAGDHDGMPRRNLDPDHQ